MSGDDNYAFRIGKFLQERKNVNVQEDDIEEIIKNGYKQADKNYPHSSGSFLRVSKVIAVMIGKMYGDNGNIRNVKIRELLIREFYRVFAEEYPNADIENIGENDIIKLGTQQLESEESKTNNETLKDYMKITEVLVAIFMKVAGSIQDLSVKKDKKLQKEGVLLEDDWNNITGENMSELLPLLKKYKLV